MSIDERRTADSVVRGANLTRPIMFDEIEPPPTLRPSINIRIEYRQVGPGPESIEVQWDAGTTFPSTDDICQVIATLLRPSNEGTDHG